MTVPGRALTARRRVARARRRIGASPRRRRAAAVRQLRVVVQAPDFDGRSPSTATCSGCRRPRRTRPRAARASRSSTPGARRSSSRTRRRSPSSTGSRPTAVDERPDPGRARGRRHARRSRSDSSTAGASARGIRARDAVALAQRAPARRRPTCSSPCSRSSGRRESVPAGGRGAAASARVNSRDHGYLRHPLRPAHRDLPQPPHEGQLTPADVDGTVREIRRALLDADVALPVVKEFTAKVRERALGDEVNKALNPAQQVVQIVNEELVAILGGQQRRLQFAKNPPTVIMLAGPAGVGQDDLRRQAREDAREGRAHPDPRRGRPPAPERREPAAGRRARRRAPPIYAPEPGNGVGDPVLVARDGVELRDAASSTTSSSSTPPAASASTPS